MEERRGKCLFTSAFSYNEPVISHLLYAMSLGSEDQWCKDSAIFSATSGLGPNNSTKYMSDTAGRYGTARSKTAMMPAVTELLSTRVTEINKKLSCDKCYEETTVRVIASLRSDTESQI